MSPASSLPGKGGAGARPAAGAGLREARPHTTRAPGLGGCCAEVRSPDKAWAWTRHGMDVSPMGALCSGIRVDVTCLEGAGSPGQPSLEAGAVSGEAA